MIKRLSAALAAVFIATSAYAAGTIPFSLSQQLDNFGALAGCQFYTIVAGTTSSPQNGQRVSPCSQVRGYPYKRSHLVALRPTKISAIDPPSTWWPGER